ncbi:uncharacterized protein SPSC_05471 [Sporisorium scitamineum]|uniref:DUF7888 domain-containing protein n=1 Tax=Sporisorium scitamineum TaxID=49012 RepID=A0A0F7S6V8_9BASI|nr:uncharacterized protein SPSC_05471 [Sporisorium scitamineum]CDW96600.1 hypothetical protein [Sporisorium scitamineum]
MQLLKTLPVFLLASMTYAANANLETSLRQSRAACIETKTRLLDEANNTFKTDAVVCYHGESSIARFGDYLTDKSPEVYRYLGYYKCGGVGIDCFWMKAQNVWQGYEDGGKDNLHALLSSRCVYKKDEVSITCN